MEELKRIIKEKRDQLDKHEDEIPQEHYYREGAIDMLDYLESIVSRVELPVKPANGGQIYLLYKRLLGYSDMTPILVEIFADVEKALDKKYKLQKDDHANSYFIEDSRLSV